MPRTHVFHGLAGQRRHHVRAQRQAVQPPCMRGIDDLPCPSGSVCRNLPDGLFVVESNQTRVSDRSSHQAPPPQAGAPTPVAKS